jgi:hypothetical protein
VVAAGLGVDAEAVGVSEYHGPYCGCCGTPLGAGAVRVWCDACRDHVLDGAGPAWECNYYARTGEWCPEVIRYWADAVASLPPA